MDRLRIKIKFNRTIDPNNQESEPCPKCGHAVCHVKENATEVFCMGLNCDFHDYTTDVVDARHKRFNYMAQFGNVFFYDNPRYSARKPFMLEADIKSHNYIVRDFELDKDLLRIVEQRGGNWQGCPKENCRVIARYYSVELLCDDGWLAEKDPKAPSIY